MDDTEEQEDNDEEEIGTLLVSVVTTAAIVILAFHGEAETVSKLSMCTIPWLLTCGVFVENW